VEFAKKIQWKYGCRVLCTLGEKGSFYVNKEYVFCADCPHVDVENLAGAGDCYLSGFVFDGGLDDVDPEKTVSAMRSAGANAAAYISGREDIETFLKNITVNYQRYFFGEGKNE
ncbi:MAG: hypothetical protein J5850_06775, partial [Clostridia bacterium]|nr:hypothetical protein [Clostridia bacterium]